MQWLLDKFRLAGKKTAVIDKKNRFTYADLYDQVKEYNKTISALFPKGSVVALESDYSFFSIAAFLALAGNQNIIAPLLNAEKSDSNTKLDQGEIQFLLMIDEKGNLSSRPHFDKIQSPFLLRLQDQEHAGLILFSSGTTGKPKAMVHDLTQMLQAHRDKRNRNLVMMVFLMFDHIGGMNTLLNCLSSTLTIVLPGSRDPEEICHLIQEFRINILPTTPTFLNMLLLSGVDKKYDLSSLKMITYGTEFMPENLLLRLNEKFPHVKFLQTFGTSEVGIADTKSFSSTSNLIKITSDEVKYKIIDGELYLKGKNQVLGYLSGDMEKFEDGWFKTGDIVEETEEGYLRIISRKDNIINVGGEKVFPSEIENCLLNLPFIEECIAYGVKSLITGETVAVDVVLTGDTDRKIAKKEIRKHSLQNLASYKSPTKINFVENIGVTQRFKKQRKQPR